jgi:uncharacterized protein
MYRLLAFTVILIFSGCNGETEERTERDTTRQLDFTSTVQFLDENRDPVSTVKVAVADDDHTRSEGLMDVHELPTDSGMLFIFDNDEPRSFWMANTPLSLDIIYANSNFEIVRIHRNTAPYSNEQILSEAPAKYVVEVNAGYTLSHDITEGMFIRLPE